MSAQDDSKIKGAASGGSNASAAVVVPCFPLNLYARRRAAAAAKTVKSASSRVAEDDEDDDDEGEEEEEEEEVKEEEEEERVGVRTRKQQQLAAKKKKERDDVLFSTRRLGVEQLLKEKPLSETQPYRCGKTYLDTRNYEIDMVEQSMHGEKLYKVFESSLKRASDKSFSLLFHGTGCKATEDIMQNGMNPKLRVSSSGDWFTKDINYALTRAICRVSSVEVCGGSSASAHPTHGVIVSPPRNGEEFTNEISPRVHVLAFVVIDERCVKIGDHIVCDSEKHSLPVFKLSFPRNVLPPSKDDVEVKQPNGIIHSPASRLASMAIKRLHHPSTPKK